MNLEDLDTLVVDADPALDVTIPSGLSADARWRYVQITGNPSGRVRPRRRIVLAVGFTALAAAALVLLLVNVIPGPSGPQSAAATVLEQAAAAAGRQNTQPAPGQFLYTETQSRYQVTIYNAARTSGDLTEVAAAQFDATEQAWTSTANTGRFIQTDSGIQFPSSADEAAWNASPMAPTITDNINRWSEIWSQPRTEQSLPNVSDLPTDPNALASVISKGDLGTNVNLIPPDAPHATFERAAWLLVGPDVGMTPALSTALFQVLANQPGVKLIGNVTDHNGQQGEAVALAGANDADVSEVVIDPTTGSVLEVQFAVPATVPQPGERACHNTGPGTPYSCTSGTTNEAVLAPVWTDLVSTGVVDSNTATLPPVGNVPTTLTLVPRAPTGLIATPENGQVELSWTAPTDEGVSPTTDYVVYEYTGQLTTAAPAVFDTHSTATNYIWSSLTDGQAYSFTIQAVSQSGYGLASSSVTAVP